MSLFYVIGVLIVAGLLIWVVNQIDQIDASMKKLIYIVVVVCVVFWLLNVFGLLGGLNVQVPRVR